MTIITTFVGNDFLPKIPSYTDTEHVIDTFNEIYTYLSLPLSEKKGNSFVIKWNNFLKLLKEFRDEWEKKNFEKIILTPKTEDFIPFKEILKAGKIIAKTEKEVKIDFDFDLFNSLWADKFFKPMDKRLEKLFPDTFYSEEDIERIALNYLIMQAWILKYYTDGFEHVNNFVFYKYKYGVSTDWLISVLEKYADRTEFLNKVEKKENEREINVMHQLLAITPPQSLYMLPAQLRECYLRELASVSPEKAYLSKEGTVKEFQRKVYVPPPNMDLIFYVYDKNIEVFPQRLRTKKFIKITKYFNYDFKDLKVNKVAEEDINDEDEDEEETVYQEASLSKFKEKKSVVKSYDTKSYNPLRKRGNYKSKSYAILIDKILL